jgi:anti-anti-sigma factor
MLLIPAVQPVPEPSDRCVLLLGLEPATRDDRVCVRCHGDVDMSTAGLLDREVRGVAERGAATITLDLHGIDFMDCSGLRVLLGLDHLAREDGWSFELAYDGGPVERLLELTDTTGRFTRAG